MIEKDTETRRILVMALVAGIAYAVFGPVGLAAVALVLLLRTGTKKSGEP